ncbi:LacI family DNA-binding transcriptional regulator [Algiphilus sp.]|uniref:LacI family DNA-binding transcriptional regulator n=1 Tax=Algiphilus sp. TaxID=1872431 RepID=UPI003B51943A
MTDHSIKDVARIAGVSIATVSRSINQPEKVSESTLHKVQEAIRQTAYSPNRLAQNFRRGRTNLVMVVLPSVGDPFFTGVIRGIRTAAKTWSYSLVIEETQHNTMNADEVGAMLVSNQTDGVILLASMSPFGTEILSARNRRLLPIVIGCETIAPELDALPSVQIDNVAAAADATNYLISQGHTRIAMISGQESSLLTKDRELGYGTAMRNAGLRVESEWVLNGDLTIAGARSATRSLLNHRVRPTAIFCANDEMAIGCLHEIKAFGLTVPGDVSIVGFDDIRYAEVADPPLTTVSQPTEEIGERVMNRLCRLIEAGEDAGAPRECVRHRLVIRQSVAPPLA